jgi:endonuclease/exonuclease/phosphatase family metal-dependent hydrolase
MILEPFATVWRESAALKTVLVRPIRFFIAKTPHEKSLSEVFCVDMGNANSQESTLKPEDVIDASSRRFSHDAEFANSDHIRVMSYNIRLDTERDGKDAWPNRKRLVADVAIFHKPNIIGFQEASPHQHRFLEEALKEHAYCQYGLARDRRDDGQLCGESCPVFWRNDQFEARDCETVCLNESREYGRRGWDAACNRVCTIVRLVARSDTAQTLVVLNTHFDHQGSLARLKSSELVLQLIAERRRSSREPVLFMGDLNAERDAECMNVLRRELVDTVAVAASNSRVRPSFQNFGVGTPMMIDYILCSKDSFIVHTAATLREEYSDGRKSSDHDPIIAELEFK